MKGQASIGMFWEGALTKLNTPKKIQSTFEKKKINTFWLSPDHLPGLADARAMKGIERMTSADWREAHEKGDELAWDTETYPGYFAIGWKNRRTGKVDWEEIRDGDAGDEWVTLDHRKVTWVINNFRHIGFNSDKYDNVMISLALSGCDTYQLKLASDMMIAQNERGSDVLKYFDARKKHPVDSVDMKEIAPGIQSLKTYGARINTHRMQDLPFPPGTRLSKDQRDIVRYYMCNDLQLTHELATALDGQIRLREKMTAQYSVDLMSKSDAQIAEQVIKHMYERKASQAATRPVVAPGTKLQYQVPEYMAFQSKRLQEVLELVRSTDFIVGESGAVDLPSELKTLKVEIGNSVYQMGIGGLHSTEKTICHLAGNGVRLMDADVASFYPRIIQNQNLRPSHLEEVFHEIYDEIVYTRLDAKPSGKNPNPVVADSLKIVINSSYGKFGSKWSFLYGPELIIQVTLTGQLSLFMLIEALEEDGISVVSANTDGIVIKTVNDAQYELSLRILDWWQKECSFEMEYTPYTAIYSRDVNNYFALGWDEKKGKTKIKRKGAYAGPGLTTTPAMNVSANAVAEFLENGTDIETYIRNCKNVFDFVTVRNVGGKDGDVCGAVWLGNSTVPPHGSPEELIAMAGIEEWYGGTFRTPTTEGEMGVMTKEDAYEAAKEKLATWSGQEYLGKVVRFYYAGIDSVIIKAAGGAKIPQSQGSKPLMTTDGSIPYDIHYETYIDEAYKILEAIGYNKATVEGSSW